MCSQCPSAGTKRFSWKESSFVIFPMVSLFILYERKCDRAVDMVYFKSHL